MKFIDRQKSDCTLRMKAVVSEYCTEEEHDQLGDRNVGVRSTIVSTFRSCKVVMVQKNRASSSPRRTLPSTL